MIMVIDVGAIAIGLIMATPTIIGLVIILTLIPTDLIITGPITGRATTTTIKDSNRISSPSEMALDDPARGCCVVLARLANTCAKYLGEGARRPPRDGRVSRSGVG
jgi:hypothetical protein